MEENVQHRNRGGNGKRVIGLVLLLVGACLILRTMHYPMPHWLFGWETILILIGLIIGIKNRFRDASWFFMVLVGSIFLIDDIWPAVSLKQFVVPIVLTVVGLIFLFSPKTSKHPRFNHNCGRKVRREFEANHARGGNFAAEEISNENFLDVTAVFGAVKKKVLSKTFAGGDITCVFGGCEVDLLNADFTSPLVLDCTQVFGGMKLIIPPDWEVRADATTLFGSVEDKRPPSSGVAPSKSIFIDGTIFFGGIEIKSF
jgi:predicted membrane protein